MSDNGYVYVLMNPSLEGMVKIGKTIREPEGRAKELSSATGVPTPFVVAYHDYFESCSDAEIFVHTYLGNKGFRISKNREFFEIPIKDAIDAVIFAKAHFGEFQLNNETGINGNDTFNDKLITKDIKPYDEVFRIAEAYHYGLSDEIQSDDDAIEYYEKSIKLGSIEAYQRVGLLYLWGEKEQKSKGFKYLKEGVKKGDFDCYAEMAIKFDFDDNFPNTVKCWDKYFKLVDKIKPYYGHYYLMFTKEKNIDIQYRDKLKAIRSEIFKKYIHETAHDVALSEYGITLYDESTKNDDLQEISYDVEEKALDKDLMFYVKEIMLDELKYFQTALIDDDELEHLYDSEELREMFFLIKLTETKGNTSNETNNMESRNKGCDNVLEMDLDQLRNCKTLHSSSLGYASSYTCYGVNVTKGLGTSGGTPEYAFAEHYGFLKQGVLGEVIDDQALENHFNNEGKSIKKLLNSIFK